MTFLTVCNVYDNAAARHHGTNVVLVEFPASQNPAGPTVRRTDAVLIDKPTAVCRASPDLLHDVRAVFRVDAAVERFKRDPLLGQLVCEAEQEGDHGVASDKILANVDLPATNCICVLKDSLQLIAPWIDACAVRSPHLFKRLSSVAAVDNVKRSCGTSTRVLGC
ncbi:hypothetical protein [Methylobacterium sp. WL12]|uniref:hypothetical protein n=1 Tax=Methylobacterium sp. WL12 TaxID=2603890 RepID=UPI001FEE91B5|nr:hypothetical protein [Methylobacterium sp. WL12]